MNTYKVISIYEQDFGCEGLPEGQEYSVDVNLENCITHENIIISVSDTELYKKNINIGSFVRYDGTIIKKEK